MCWSFSPSTDDGAQDKWWKEKRMLLSRGRRNDLPWTWPCTGCHRRLASAKYGCTGFCYKHWGVCTVAVLWHIHCGRNPCLIYRWCWFVWDLLLTDQSGLLAAGWLDAPPQGTRERYRSTELHVSTVMFHLSILTFNIDSLIPFLRVHDWQLAVVNGTKMSTECSSIS